MVKGRLEIGDDNFGGREKKRGWKRKSTDDKYREVENLFGEKELKETPPPAKVLHIGSRLPKDAVRGKSAPNNKPKENKPVSETDSVPVADARELLPAKSDEEKLAGLEEEINSDLTDLEQKFAKSCIDDYPEEIKKAIKKIESNGSTITEKKISAIRTSYIGDVKRWGLGRQLAPEKAELIGKYLDLKLPAGIPEEKMHNSQENVGETKKDLKSLTIINKKMEKHINIGERIKQDREELEAARMVPSVVDSKSSTIDSSGGKGKNIEEALSDQAIKNQRKINRARGFAPKGMKNIAKVSTDDVKTEKHGEVASEVSPDAPPVAAENDPTAGQKTETKSADVPPPVAPKTDAEPASDQHPYVFHQGDEFAALSGDWKEKGDFAKISDKERWMKTSEADLDLNAKLAEMKKEVDEFGKNYSKVAGEAGAKQGIIRKLNPFSNPEDYDEVKQALAEWKQKRDEFERAFYQDLAMKFSRGEIDEKTVDRLSNDFDTLITKEAIGAHGQKFDFRKDYSEGKGWISSKVANGYNNFTGRFRKMHPALRIGLGAGVFVLGNVPATMIWRALGGLAAGKGAQEGLQAAAEIWRQRKERKALQKFEREVSGKNLSVQERINSRLERLEKQNQGMEQKMAKYARGDYYRKFAGVLIAGLIGSGTVARLIQSTGLGGAVKEKLFGGGAAAMQAQESMAIHAPEVKTGGGLMGYGTEADGHNLVDAHPEGKYGPGLYGSEAEGHISETEVKTGGSAQAWAETTPAKGAEVQMPEIAKPQFEDIAAVKIKAGGNMWGSIENNIKANPAAYGLDPNDPGFTKDMHRMTQQMLDEFASRKGLSYEQLDQMARGGKIQPGSTFNIIHNPSTDEIYLDDKGKIFGADVSPGGAGATHEIAPTKAGMTVEDAKPKASVAPEDATRPRAGAAAEQQPTRARGGGKIAGMEEIDARQHAAQAKYADAVRAEQEWHNIERPKVQADIARDLAMANHQSYLANRVLLGDVFHEFGISKYYNIYDQPMSKWNDLIGTSPNIAQDVSQADAVNASNESWKKLNDLHSMLKYYNTSGHETIGECLRRSLADPRIGRFGKGESIGAVIQRAINEILNNKK